MFMLIDDGGTDTEDQHQAERILLQRIFIMRILFGGIAVSLLSDLEFLDMKVFLIFSL